MGTGELLEKPNRFRGSDLRRTSIPSRGSRNTPSRLMLHKAGLISSRSYEPVGSKASLFYTIFFPLLGVSLCRGKAVMVNTEMSGPFVHYEECRRVVCPQILVSVILILPEFLNRVNYV